MPDNARALNRFGLGAALGEAPPRDARRWLNAQIDGFDPRPASIAAALPTGKLIEMLRDSRDEKKDLKAEAKQTGLIPSR